MSQVEAFNDNVTEITATQPFMALTKPPKRATDPVAAELEKEGTQTPAPGGNPRDSRWPRWPTAWPDGSRQSRSRQADQ
jgi:hypothetical protein